MPTAARLANRCVEANAGTLELLGDPEMVFVEHSGDAVRDRMNRRSLPLGSHRA